MSTLSYRKLSDQEISSFFADVPYWSIENGALARCFSFESYASGLAFASAVGYAADKLNHHPDIQIGFGMVRVSMVTHDAEGGLTAYDFELAKRINTFA